nr:MAG TPA: hypothetical protein [Caudoviricetes sp.]
MPFVNTVVPPLCTFVRVNKCRLIVLYKCNKCYL